MKSEHIKYILNSSSSYRYECKEEICIGDKLEIKKQFIDEVINEKRQRTTIIEDGNGSNETTPSIPKVDEMNIDELDNSLTLYIY